MRHKNIIVSPSGQLYGSENVLFDFLKGSNSTYEIYVPANSSFYDKLKKNDFNPKGYKNLKWLYLSIFFKLLFSKNNLYINEGGHISYVKILARFFPKRKFVVAVRLLEDCNEKLVKISPNVTLVAVSNFLLDEIKTNGNKVMVYDPFKLNHKEYLTSDREDQKFTVGLVGRVIKTKGLNELIPIIKKIEHQRRRNIHFCFFGTYDKTSQWFIQFENELNSIPDCNYFFKGFCSDKNSIYTNCDLILHLNKVEALGRIIFEAIDWNVPFLCFNKGGIGELCTVLGLEEYTVLDNMVWVKSFASRISKFTGLKKDNRTNYDNAVKMIEEKFNPDFYASRIEKYL